jgi:hypothetical protein
MDAQGDGEVLVVMDLRVDASLEAAGVARETVNRVQKLRKKAGLQVGTGVCLSVGGWVCGKDAGGHESVGGGWGALGGNRLRCGCGYVVIEGGEGREVGVACPCKPFAHASCPCKL